MFLYYYSSDIKMHKCLSLEKINGTEVASNARNRYFAYNSIGNANTPPKRRFTPYRSVYEQYSITIKPKLIRSSSLSDLTTITSDFTIDFFKQSTKFLTKGSTEALFDGSSGDANTKHCTKNQANKLYMSWNFKGKKPKKKSEMSPDSYASKFATEYIHNTRERINAFDPSSYADNSSTCTTEHSVQKIAAFPFKSTPSGNLKVQSNQVVFQSSTVGVLLADPTQAKVKVKFEDDSGDEDEDENCEEETELEPQLQYGQRDPVAVFPIKATCGHDTKSKAHVKEDKSKDLAALGYSTAEPVDWMRVQLPKKQDLFQEFYRRIHNHINTDTVIHIGDEDFHCHRIILQIYSSFFHSNPVGEIELPISNVTPEAFQTIYEWMIFSGPESNKVLKRDNVLKLFCAAQYLAIKDLEEQCWSFIVNENLFTEDTAFTLFREARVKGMEPVMDLMVPRVMRFFLPLVASKDFIKLEPEEVMTFLKSNYICVTSEIEVLMAGVRWLYGDWSARRRFAVDVMRCVRFGLISPWQLVDIKRNPDNAEILEIVNECEVQQMVDDGLAYVIIKYWYGNNSKSYYHWIDVLGLTEPAERNWIGEEKNHVTYKDFLKYLEQFMVAKDQLYQQMSVMQPPRRNDDNIMHGGSLRAIDTDKIDMRRPKLDFPLPATLKAFTGDKEKSFPNMKEFIENRKMGQDFYVPSPSNSSPMEDGRAVHDSTCARRSPELDRKEQMPVEELRPQPGKLKHHQGCDPPERDSTEELNTSYSDTNSEIAGTSSAEKQMHQKHGEKRLSVAACYLAAATAALAGTRQSQSISPTTPRLPTSQSSRQEQARSAAPTSQNKFHSPQLSLFNQSKESLAKMNMKKLSASILGPSNKNYFVDGSLFNWDRETVLVFGGINPHGNYGVNGKNTGQDIYRFDPVTNSWEHVGVIPEPRHHHSVAFLRGRVYLVGGADPRDDDIRGKSAVVSTVWSFEPVTQSWFSETGLITPRKDFGLVVHRMALYVIGGQDKKGRVLRSVERFDPKTGTWSEMKSMGVARMAAATAKYREYIWVAGGMTGEKKRPVCKVVECYNSNTNEWTEIHNLRFPRCFCTLFAMNDKLYLVGGAGRITEKDKTANSVGAIDVWEWKERHWRHHTEMSIPRHGHALAYLGTQLIIIGGVTTIYTRALSNVESFCCERNAWIRGVAALPTPLSGHGAVTLPPASLM